MRGDKARQPEPPAVCMTASAWQTRCPLMSERQPGTKRTENRGPVFCTLQKCVLHCSEISEHFVFIPSIQSLEVREEKQKQRPGRLPRQTKGEKTARFLEDATQSNTMLLF